MKKPEKSKTDPLGWIMAVLFPKKSKPLVQPKPEPALQTPSSLVKTTAAPAAAPQPKAEVVIPVAAPPQVIHSVSAPPQAQAAPPAVTAAPAPSPSQSQLIKTAPKTDAAQKKTSSGPGKGLATFWTVASTLSLIVNVILIIVLLILGRELFVLKALVGDQLLGGLYENFIYMDQAHIQTNITVADNIPINFTLPISQDTVVVLQQDTPINGANVRINSGGLTINSAANIVLPAGTNLPVHLELNVPVNTTVPIKLNVPVDIPLEKTELHKPFIGLQQVVAPFYNLLLPQIKTSQDVPLCKPLSWFCNAFFAR
jgi:hypothetical protein